MKLRVLTVAALALVGAVFSIPQGSGHSAADDVIVSADFVGIPSEVEGAHETVTWYGVDGGEVGVLWASSRSIDIRPYEDAPDVLVPEFVGQLGDGQLEAVERRLAALGAARRDLMSPASAQVVSVICSLVIADPYYSFWDDAAIGSSHQSCSGHLEHFVESKIRQQRWLWSYRTIGHDTSGWETNSSLAATAKGWCTTSDAKRWKNWGNGDAIGQDLTFFNGPSASTDATKLGCKH